MTQLHGNLGSTERWVSALSGAALLLASLARGRFLGRSFGAAAGASLIARAAAGHCGVKSALSGETSLEQGLRDQWEHMRTGLSGTAAEEIGSMDELYFAEVQELHSAEAQLCSLLEEVAPTISSVTLSRTLSGYGTEVRTRGEDLARILRADGVNPREHPDQAMSALLRETRKMARVCASNIRSAALIASVQRVLHYKIAGYGTVATYAQTLGFIDEASRLAEYADRDKAVDEELSGIAKELVNPRAAVQPDASGREPELPRHH
jgi:ferritin-like metal-binding protein YciE